MSLIDVVGGGASNIIVIAAGNTNYSSVNVLTYYTQLHVVILNCYLSPFPDARIL